MTWTRGRNLKPASASPRPRSAAWTSWPRRSGCARTPRRGCAASTATASGDEENYEDRSIAFQRFQHEVLAAQRAELLRLRNEGFINDEVMRRVERDLDLEEARLEV